MLCGPGCWVAQEPSRRLRSAKAQRLPTRRAAIAGPPITAESGGIRAPITVARQDTAYARTMDPIVPAALGITTYKVIAASTQVAIGSRAAAYVEVTVIGSATTASGYIAGIGALVSAP